MLGPPLESQLPPWPVPGPGPARVGLGDLEPAGVNRLPRNLSGPPAVMDSEPQC
jgi:hypothetical protein